MVRFLLTLSVLFGCSEELRPNPVQAEVVTAAPGDSLSPVELPWLDGNAYDDELRRIDQLLVTERRLADAQPTSWSAVERLVGTWTARARLSGSIDDYLSALEALDEAFARAPEGGGPHITRASLLFTVHRLAEMEPAIESATGAFHSGAIPLAEIEGLRGDLALNRLQLSSAQEHYLSSEQLDPTSTAAFRRAMYHWQAGDFERADEVVQLAQDRRHGGSASTAAYLHLQRGLLDLDRGRYSDALAHYREADALFPGWWLVQEHIAEIVSVEGDSRVAEAAYRDLVERTRNPELMGALADLLEEQGRIEQAHMLRADAGEIFEEQLEVLPEAAFGHALSHFLGTDPGRALGLAEQNYEVRPNGEAHIGLAQALALNGRWQEAAAPLEAALQSDYRSAELHATAAVVFEELGDARAAAERESAEAIREGVTDEISAMLVPER